MVEFGNKKFFFSFLITRVVLVLQKLLGSFGREFGFISKENAYSIWCEMRCRAIFTIRILYSFVSKNPHLFHHLDASMVINRMSYRK